MGNGIESGNRAAKRAQNGNDEPGQNPKRYCNDRQQNNPIELINPIETAGGQVLNLSAEHINGFDQRQMADRYEVGSFT